MRSKFDKALNIALLLPILSVLSFAEVEAEPSGEALYKSSAELQATMPPNAGGKTVVGQILEGSQAQILVARAVTTGGAEMHGAIDVFYYADAGHADVLVGSRLEGGHERAPNEWAGGKIVGGRTYSMSPGDILWMPAGTAHQVVVPEGGSFTYIVVRHASVNATGK